MGNETVTIQNLEVARVLPEKGLILVRGPVPGGDNGYVQIRHAIKPAIRAKHGA
jgi:large subunit ribosomal protein L3